MINMIFPSTICFIVLIFIFFYIGGRRHNDHRQPPSPARLPLLGNFHQLSSLPFRSLKDLSDKYGPLMLIHFGCEPVLIVSSAEVAREVMKTHDLTFSGRPALGMVERLMYNCDLALAPYGEYWRQVRRIAVLHLLSVKRVDSFRAAREEEVSLLVDKIRASSAAGRGGALVNVSEMSVSLTNDVISRAALGRKYSREEDAGVHATLKEFTSLMGSYLIGDFIPWFGWIDAVRGLNARVRNNFRQVDCFLERVLDEHLHSKTKTQTQTQTHANFVDVLLALNDDAGGNISLTRDNIKAIILDMFLGGTDTTSTTIEWAMSELIRNPEVMKRLQQEVRATSVVGCKEKVTEEELEKMEYLKAVIKETLRLHPPIPMLVPRETIERVELRGYEIPAGTQVMINAWTIGRDPVSWGDRPGEFFPDRFMNTSSSSVIDFRGKDFQLIPFGSGRRGCPGLGFAIAMIQVTLANLLSNFDWELPDGMRGEALDMTEIQDVTVHRKSDLILVATPPSTPVATNSSC